MVDKTLIFFQKLINDPSLSDKEHEQILRGRKKYIKSLQKKQMRPEGPNETDETVKDDWYAQSINVAKLLSNFDEGNRYGIILHPKKVDNSAFCKELPSIQKMLIKDVLSTSIPKTLKALLFLFVLGKYGTYKEWISVGGKMFNITCASKKIQDLCINNHPKEVSELAYYFEQFELSITVNTFILNKILDVFENAFCKPMDVPADMSINELNKELENSLDSEIPLTDQKISRTIERCNLDKVFFHTHTRIFYTAMVWLFTNIVRYSPKDVKISVSYKEEKNRCSIIVRHKLFDNRVKVGELLGVKQKLSKIIAGYADVYVETYYENATGEKESGPIRIFLVPDFPLKSELIDKNDGYTTYYINFYKI